MHTSKSRQTVIKKPATVTVHFRELDDVPVFIFTDAWYFLAIHLATISLSVSAHNLAEMQFWLEDKLLLHDSYIFSLKIFYPKTQSFSKFIYLRFLADFAKTVE